MKRETPLQPITGTQEKGASAEKNNFNLPADTFQKRMNTNNTQKKTTFVSKMKTI
jgi:hypothetical protein